MSPHAVARCRAVLRGAQHGGESLTHETPQELPGRPGIHRSLELKSIGGRAFFIKSINDIIELTFASDDRVREGEIF